MLHLANISIRMLTERAVVLEEGAGVEAAVEGGAGGGVPVVARARAFELKLTEQKLEKDELNCHI